MPLLGPNMTAAIISALTAKGFVGTGMPLMAQAIGNGSVASIVGKAFATTDVGTGNGPGAGSGLGITGVVSSAVKGFIQTEALSQGLTPTSKATDVYGAVADGLVAELANATLTSTHTPVAVGTGTINPGSIPVSGSEWGGNIKTAGIALGMGGSKWPNFAQAIGGGGADGFATASGSVTIVGSPIGTPTPATGSGSGLIS